eukprot:GHVU01077921.1.p1 GENE.GHVU01077921.1~~GHVU01077921.1.p1  ORF type:complete len:212 (+),score=16.88 GHVU01077921.1:70-705(+)
MALLSFHPVQLPAPLELPVRRSLEDEPPLSIELCRVLRHQATRHGLILSRDGYVALDELLLCEGFSHLKKDDVLRAVGNDPKGRFGIKEEDSRTWIRANQGHSISVDIGLLCTQVASPDEVPTCIHGTSRKAWFKIRNAGLSRRGRVHIHMAAGEPGSPGVISGVRERSAIYIYVDVRRAMEDGIEFYRSENNVILTTGVNGIIEPKYFCK